MIDESDTIPYGSNEDAIARTEGRHQGTRDALLWLAYRHLPQPLRRFSAPLYDAACVLVKAIPDSPALTTALNGLVSSKDWAVRAGILGMTGSAGSIPRPQEVIDPPPAGSATPAVPHDFGPSGHPLDRLGD